MVDRRSPYTTWAAVVAVAVLMATSPANAQEAPSGVFSPVEVQELVLDNGFRVLLVEDPRVPRVAASIWFRVGAMQEHYGEHGSTHFLEHAIAQGTTTIGTVDFEAERAILEEIRATEDELVAERNAVRNSLRQREVFFEELAWPGNERLRELRERLYELEDRQAEYRIHWAEYNWYRRHGGIMRHTDPVPATTGNEYMDFDIDLPRERVELFFRIEADRMSNAVLRGWEAQRFTVLEQILNRFNRPETGRFSEALNGATAIVHPVYLTPGGHLRDFAYYDRASMLRMYDDYFVPNNATLALVGDITMDEARRLAERYFGRIPRGPEPPARMDVEPEPPPGGAIRLEWHEPMDSRVVVRYRIPGLGHQDRPAFDTIAAALDGPRGMLASREHGGGRIGTALGVRFSANARATGSQSTIDLVGRASRDEDLPAVEAAILEAVESLRDGGIEASALSRARKALRLDWERIRSERARLSEELGRFQVRNDWRVMQPFMQARQGASAEEIRRVARRYFVPWNRVIAVARRDIDPPAGDHLVSDPGSGDGVRP